MAKNMLKTGLSIFTLFILAMGTVFAGTSGTFSGSSSGFDVSIDRVIANSQVVSQSRNNLLADSNVFALTVDATAIKTLEKGHIEATLRGRQSGDSVADSTATFDIAANTSFNRPLNLVLNDGLRRENDFELTVKIVDARGRSEQKTYGIKTGQTTRSGGLDVSIDRVRLNNQVLAASRNTLVNENDTFAVLVDFTSLEESDFTHVEAVLRDLNTGNSVADSTATSNIAQDSTNTAALRLNLVDDMDKSDAFELIVKISNAEGQSVKQTYGVRMDENLMGVNGLDLSIDSVEVEDNILTTDGRNFVDLGDNRKNLDVKVKMTSLEKIDGARIDAVLTFENGNTVADTTATFNIGKDESAAKDLELSLIGKFIESNLKLKIKVTDTEGSSTERTYELRLSRQKNPFLLSSISLNDGNIQAGKSLGIGLNIRNMGVAPIEAVVAKVSIDELGISSTRFVDKISSSNKEEFILKIPENANAGTYTIKAEVTSQFSSEAETSEISFTIGGKSEEAASGNKLRINVPVTSQNLNNDGREAAYQVTFTNNDVNTHLYTIMLGNGESLDLRLGESNTFVLKPKDSNTINVYASTRAKEAGEQSFNVLVRENQKTISTIQLKANVNVQSGIFGSGLKAVLMVILILITIGLAGLGAAFGIRNYLQKDEAEDDADESITKEIPTGEAYY